MGKYEPTLKNKIILGFEENVPDQFQAAPRKPNQLEPCHQLGFHGYCMIDEAMNPP